MRVALRIAYDGRRFYGHQRQPDAPTVEGECLAALRAGRVVSDPRKAFFRSASRTDRGVSALGNVIAFDTPLHAEAALGAFNGKAHGVWAWAYANVPDTFHPRHAEERWYRYHLLEPYPLDLLRRAAALFPGEHDFRWFTSDPPPGSFAIGAVDVSLDEGLAVIDVRGRSFRRGMIRRIVAAVVGHASGDVPLAEIRAALEGERRDFGMVPAEGLFLMGVRYGFPFTTVLKPKVLDEWRQWQTDLTLRSRFLRDLYAAAGLPGEELRAQSPPARGATPAQGL